MLSALRRVLGDHVHQKGSNITAERLRFDFSHPKALMQTELHAIEQLVNKKIRENLLVETQICDLEEAKARGAIALFDEKYEDKVRVVKMGDFSLELCGGTHVKRTGDMGTFKIINQDAIAAGVRRLEAITGEAAIFDVQAKEHQLKQLENQLREQKREAEKEITKLKQQIAQKESSNLTDQVEKIGNINLLVTQLEHADMKTLRDTMDGLKQKLSPCVILLAAIQNEKVQLLVGVSKELTQKISAVDLLNHVAEKLDGKGGGRPDLAQGGGNKINLLSSVLSTIKDWVERQVH